MWRFRGERMPFITLLSEPNTESEPKGEGQMLGRCLRPHKVPLAMRMLLDGVLIKEEGTEGCEETGSLCVSSALLL